MPEEGPAGVSEQKQKYSRKCGVVMGHAKPETLGFTPLNQQKPLSWLFDHMTYKEIWVLLTIAGYLFAVPFSSVFTRDDTSPIPDIHGNPHPSMGNLVVTENGARKLLARLVTSKAPGPDAIPNTILKEE